LRQSEPPASEPTVPIPPLTNTQQPLRTFSIRTYGSDTSLNKYSATIKNLQHQNLRFSKALLCEYKTKFYCSDTSVGNLHLSYKKGAVLQERGSKS